MQKVKQIFSSHDDNSTSGSTRDSTGSNYATGTTSGLGSGHNESSTATGTHTGAGLGHNTSSSGLTSGTTGSNTNVGERGLGRDPVAGSTGHGTMSHGGLDNRSSTGTNSGSTGGGIAEKLTGGHSFGHNNRTDNKFDPTGENTSHDHKHLEAVTHATHRHIEVEEVERQREQHRHVHHLQHHVQPVVDKQVKDEVHHQNVVPVTRINEKHANTEEDVKLFQSLGEKHRNEEKHLPKERTVVDLGEKVNEITHHHVHHVTQPVVEQEVHDKHRIHTVIPLTHTVHEAPIIHKSSVHEPVHMADFLKGGGKLDSGITHRNTDILSTGECDRTVDGVGEKLMQDLNLRGTSGNYGNSGSSYGNNTSSGLTGNNTGSGLTGNTTGSHGTSGLTGSHGSSGLTGSHGSSGLTGSHGSSGLTGNNTTASHGLTDNSTGLSGGHKHDSNLTGTPAHTSSGNSGQLPPGTGPGTTGIPATNSRSTYT